MTAEKTCECGENHQGHLCMLKSKGLLEEVRHLTSKPTVVCFTCGSEANSADNVCMPMKIGN